MAPTTKAPYLAQALNCVCPGGVYGLLLNVASEIQARQVQSEALTLTAAEAEDDGLQQHGCVWGGEG